MVRIPEIQRVVEFATGPQFQAEARRASREFRQVREGSIHGLLDDPDEAFLDWFVFDRPLLDGRTFPGLYAEAHPALDPETRRNVLGLSRSVVGAFTILEMHPDGFLVREYPSRREFRVDQRQDLDKLEEGYSLLARLLPWGDRYVVGNARVLPVALTISEVDARVPSALGQGRLNPLGQVVYELALVRALRMGIRKVDAYEKAMEEMATVLAQPGPATALLRRHYGEVADLLLREFSVDAPRDAVLGRVLSRRVADARDRLWKNLRSLHSKPEERAAAGGVIAFLAAALASQDGARSIEPRHLQRAAGMLADRPQVMDRVLEMLTPALVST